MTEKVFSTRDLFVAARGDYPNYSALEDRLVAVYGEHATQLPMLLGINQLLEIGRERGWISSTEESIKIEPK